MVVLQAGIASGYSPTTNRLVSRFLITMQNPYLPQVIAVLTVGLVLLPTYKGLKDADYFYQNSLMIGAIRRGKEYGRLFSHGFLHVNWWHYGFNAIAIVSFGEAVIAATAWYWYLMIFTGSIVAGGLLATQVHRKDPEYTAVGASGGAFGLMMAYVLMFPFGNIGLLLIPIEFPAWALAVVLIAVSIYGSYRGFGNIGHSAHLGGAYAGMLLALVAAPDLAGQYILLLIGLLGPMTLAIALLSYNPDLLRLSRYTEDDYLRAHKPPPPTRQERLDALLAKIASSGIDSLTKKERKELERLSR